MEVTIDVNDIPKEDRSVTNVQKLAESIRRYCKFAKDDGGWLYYYDEGKYNPRGDEIIGELYVKLLKAYDRGEDWRAGRAKDIHEYISITSPKLWERPQLEVINLKNGLYDWCRQELQPHSHEYLSTIQIPVEYDPDRDCSGWDSFLEEVFPVGVSLLHQIMALCLIPFTNIQKCIVLVGSGSNGKSTFLNGLQALIGVDNISNVSLHQLTNPMEKFSKAGIVGKLVNVFGDLSSKKIEDAANFKPLVGEDRLVIERKFASPFYYSPFCRLIFSCNEVMKSDDDSLGYKRRFLNVPFTQRFSVDAKKGMELASTLSDPKELSGLLNKLLPLLPNLVEEGFTISPAVAEIVDNYHPMPDSTRLWLEENVEVVEGGYLPMTTFYNYFSTHCPASGETISRSKVITYMKQTFGEIEVGINARIKGGEVVRCYRGVKMRNRETDSIIYNPRMKDDVENISNTVSKPN